MPGAKIESEVADGQEVQEKLELNDMRQEMFFNLISERQSKISSKNLLNKRPQKRQNEISIQMQQVEVQKQTEDSERQSKTQITKQTKLNTSTSQSNLA